jgi:hypothetical protein
LLHILPAELGHREIATQFAELGRREIATHFACQIGTQGNCFTFSSEAKSQLLKFRDSEQEDEKEYEETAEEEENKKAKQEKCKRQLGYVNQQDEM